jgi:hypothetical protein
MGTVVLAVLLVAVVMGALFYADSRDEPIRGNVRGDRIALGFIIFGFVVCAGLLIVGAVLSLEAK